MNITTKSHLLGPIVLVLTAVGTGLASPVQLDHDAADPRERFKLFQFHRDAWQASVAQRTAASLCKLPFHTETVSGCEGFA